MHHRWLAATAIGLAACGGSSAVDTPADAAGVPDVFVEEVRGIGMNVGGLVSAWSDAPEQAQPTPPATTSFANPGGLKVLADGSVLVAGTFVGDIGFGATTYTAPSPNSAVFVVKYAPDRHVAQVWTLPNPDGSVANVFAFDATAGGAMALERSIAGSDVHTVSYTSDGSTWSTVTGVDPRFGPAGDLFVRDPAAATMSKIATAGGWTVSHAGVFLGFDATGGLVVGDQAIDVLAAADGAVGLHAPVAAVVTGGRVGAGDTLAFADAGGNVSVLPLSGTGAGTVRWTSHLPELTPVLRGIDLDPAGGLMVAVDSRRADGTAQSDVLRVTQGSAPTIQFQMRAYNVQTIISLFGLAADGDDAWVTGSYRGNVIVGGRPVVGSGISEHNSRWLFAVKVLGTNQTFRAARLSDSVEPNNIMPPVRAPGGSSAILAGGFGYGSLAVAPGATVFTNLAPVTNFAGRVFVGEVH